MGGAGVRLVEVLMERGGGDKRVVGGRGGEAWGRPMCGGGGRERERCFICEG